MYGIYEPGKLTEMAKALYKEEREFKRLDGWFIAKETEMKKGDKYVNYPHEIKKAYLLCEVLKEMPLFVSDNAIFVGTQRDAFARSYALINPSFTVEGFSGYRDPMAIYNDIEPSDEFTKERIDKVRSFTSNSKMVEMLNKTYSDAEDYTKEVIFFVEQVTGHVIPDFRFALKHGVDAMINQAKSKDGEFYEAAAIALGGVKILVDRYIEIIKGQKKSCSHERFEQLDFMEKSLINISSKGAENFYEALQLYILLWTVMCIEQAPNPYAFSVGNADRILNHTEASFQGKKQANYLSTSWFSIMWVIGAGQFRRKGCRG